jgi:hypothetical protein
MSIPSHLSSFYPINKASYLQTLIFKIPVLVSDVEVRSPRFTGQGWLAFPALRAAYKHVQLELEFRPEAWDGILFLSGERDDMAGDFMALLLHQGFVEFR